MTTLRSFQADIDNIRAHEVSKQRKHAIAQMDQENAKGKGKEKENGEKPAAVNALDHYDLVNEDAEASIQSLLLTKTLPDHDKARDNLATLITQNHGEYVLRIGIRPPSVNMFACDLNEDTDGFTGTPRTAGELDYLTEAISAALDEIGGKTSILFRTDGKHARTSLLLRLPPPSVSLTPEVRCAVVGNVDSGKSTTLGVLTRVGALDDGRGRARVGLFRHKHEMETGRTSSVGMEILGFNTSGAPILPNTAHSNDPDTIRREKMGWEEISTQAAKIVSFIDLAGHERYLKTTLYGLTSGAPSCIILIVGANAGLIGMSKEHLAIGLALGVPIVVCITKIDMTPANVLAETQKQVVKILKSPGCRKVPVFVKSTEVAVELAQCFGREKLCPIFQLSNVTGEGLDHFRTFLNLLPSSEADEDKFAINHPLEFSITEIWSVPYVGTVVNGIVNAGTVKTGDAVMFGPDANGNYQNTIIRSMQRKRANVKSADAGQCVSLALKRTRRADVRKGMVLVHKTETPPRPIKQFEGQVLILYHNTTLQRNYQAMLHCGAIRQTVRIIGMDHPNGVLRTGDRATVQFEFISHPEFIKEGMKLLFREGKTKGLGMITRLL
ncbi:GTP-binding protein 1 [Pleurotus eryngii]|uniref:GTP-binding protein 1 n=1 Tax=Pleurotus eryngii TaxID=5323 RepID=A0A9P6ABV1_PLEER|nr:GTP-binding protein 1 [Pleurotus eryngii]